MTYGKPIWVTEFACVDGKSAYRSVTNSPLLTEITMKDLDQFTPCTDQEEINNFINEIIPYFESNPNIFAYAYSNGEGLGDVWPLVKGDSLRLVLFFLRTCLPFLVLRSSSANQDRHISI